MENENLKPPGGSPASTGSASSEMQSEVLATLKIAINTAAGKNGNAMETMKWLQIAQAETLDWIKTQNAESSHGGKELES